MYKRLALFSLFTLCLTSCGGDNLGTGANTLIYGRGGDAEGLDPIHESVGETVKVLVNVYDTLITYDDKTLELVPGLAESWESSDEGLVWTFHLREGVKFHDGTNFNADAVIFSLERLIEGESHPHVHSAVIPFQPSYQVIDKIEAIDPLTVRITLKHPDAVFEQNLCVYAASIVSPTAVKKYGKDFAENPVGTGPFKFVHWNRDEELILERFEDYWRKEPIRLERVIFVPVSESTVRVKQLKRGEIHIADNLPPAELDALEGEPGIRLQEETSLSVGYLAINNERPPLNLPKVRKAIWHAIDKQQLIEDQYVGHATSAVNMVPPAMWAYNDDLTDREHDPQKARTLLEEAAAEHGFSLPLELQLFVMNRPRPYMPLPDRTAVFIKDQLERVSIEVTIVKKDINEHFQSLSRGEHDLGLAGWTNDNNDPDNSLYQLLHSENIHAKGNNLARFRNAEFDELITAAKQELDRDKRQELYHRAQEIVWNEAPTVPLVHTPGRVAQRDELRGYKLHPSSLVRLRHAYLEGDDE